jgi:hypothetical protein
VLKSVRIASGLLACAAIAAVATPPAVGGTLPDGPGGGPPLALGGPALDWRNQLEGLFAGDVTATGSASAGSVGALGQPGQRGSVDSFPDDLGVIAEAGQTSTMAAPSALASSGLPLAAAQAYRRAAQYVATTDPSCGLHWSVLAGIGRVESNHGRFAGAVLGADGRSRPPVIGIPLDGTHDTALIRDSDRGRLDGDTVYDRAVGAMQFIPETWVAVAQDGDGDGIRDAQDIDDAARSAAVYLCLGESELRTYAGSRAAVWRYNHSYPYVDLVLSLASLYETGGVVELPDAVGRVPVGPFAPLPPLEPLPPLDPITPPTRRRRRAHRRDRALRRHQGPRPLRARHPRRVPRRHQHPRRHPR